MATIDYILMSRRGLGSLGAVLRLRVPGVARTVPLPHVAAGLWVAVPAVLRCAVLTATSRP